MCLLKIVLILLGLLLGQQGSLVLGIICVLDSLDHCFSTGGLRTIC